MFKKSNDIHTIVYKEQSLVKIGQPVVYPSNIVDVLRKEFIKFQNLKAAYLGWIFDPKSELPPHLIIGIAVIDNKGGEIITSSVRKIEKHLRLGEFIDFVILDDDKGIMGYLKNTNPFYTSIKKDNPYL